jgi:DNA (cytosine-5)-methyltransferase 1/site-specific DNA-methyltransferase (adenine-specific)
LTKHGITRSNADKGAVPRYRILDLFSGAGGFSLGLDSLDEFETVVANDFMQDALLTLKANMPQVETIFGDITASTTKKAIVDASKRASVNMVIGGPPCQGFSNKGKKLGLKDPRNFLFREYLALVAELQPEIFVIENVKAMSTSTNGWFMAEILSEIDKLGYSATHGILTASDFGVPQIRQRTFIIASKAGLIKLPDPNKIKTPKVTVREAISDLAFLESGEGADEQSYLLPAESKYQKKLRTGSKKLFNHKATNHAEIAVRKLSLIPAEQGKEALPPELLGKQKFKTTWGRLRWEDQSPTIDTRFDTPSNGTNSHPTLNRSITPREAARLQSFPDTYRFVGSKTNIGKQIGNAVPPLLARAVGMAILAGPTTDECRLILGDSVAHMKGLIRQGVLVDHIITDPPYNISKSNNLATLKTAKRQGVDFGEWDKEFDLVGWISLAAKLIRPGGSFIVFNSYRNLTPIIDALEAEGFAVKDVIRWVKSNPMPRNMNRRYVQDTEYAIWAVTPGKPWVFNRPSNAGYLRAEFNTPTVAGLERTNHPTQKSLKLMREIIRIHSNAQDLIFDPFMGSGTTGVAALAEKRAFLGIELESKYFQIAESRLGVNQDGRSRVTN